MGFGLFVEEFGSRLRGKREQEYERQKLEDENELRILEVLAKTGGDGIRELAGAAMLDLAQQGPGRRPRAKGIRGFLGEAQQSPHLEAIRRAASTPGAATSTISAALPAGSPVQPGGPQMTPAATAPQGPAPRSTLQGAQGPMQPTPIDGVTAMMPAPPDPLQATDRTVSGMLPAEPKIRALFPTAEEIAEKNAMATLRGRMNAFRQGAGEVGMSPEDIQAGLRGIVGAPSRRPAAPRLVIGTVNGQPNVTGIFNPETQEITVDGEPVEMTDTRFPSSSAPRPPQTGRVIGPNGEVQVFAYPPLQPGQAAVIPDVQARQPVPPPATSGTVTLGPDAPEGPGVYERDRAGGLGGRLGSAPEPRTSSGQSAEQKQYKAWLDIVKMRISQESRTRMGVLPRARLDRITEEETGIPGLTYNDLVSGAAGVEQNRGGRTGVKKSDMQTLIDNALKRLGVPPAAPPPP